MCAGFYRLLYVVFFFFFTVRSYDNTGYPAFAVANIFKHRFSKRRNNRPDILVTEDEISYNAMSKSRDVSSAHGTEQPEVTLLPTITDITMSSEINRFRRFLKTNPTFSDDATPAKKQATTLKTNPLYYVWTTHETFMPFIPRPFDASDSTVTFSAQVLDIHCYANYVDFAIDPFVSSNGEPTPMSVDQFKNTKARISLKILRHRYFGRRSSVHKAIKYMWKNVPSEKKNWAFELESTMDQSKGTFKTVLFLRYPVISQEKWDTDRTPLFCLERAIEVLKKLEENSWIMKNTPYELGVGFHNKKLIGFSEDTFAGTTVQQAVLEYLFFARFLRWSFKQAVDQETSETPPAYPFELNAKFLSKFASLLRENDCVQLPYPLVSRGEQPTTPEPDASATSTVLGNLHVVTTDNGSFLKQNNPLTFVTGAYVSRLLYEEQRLYRETNWFAVNSKTKKKIARNKVSPLLVRFCGSELDEPCGYDACVLYLPVKKMEKWEGVGRISLNTNRKREACTHSTAENMSPLDCLKLEMDSNNQSKFRRVLSRLCSRRSSSSTA